LRLLWARSPFQVTMAYRRGAGLYRMRSMSSVSIAGISSRLEVAATLSETMKMPSFAIHGPQRTSAISPRVNPIALPQLRRVKLERQ